MTRLIPTSLKRSVLAIGGAALLAASCLGLAYAQSAPPPTVPGPTVSQHHHRPGAASHHGHRLRKLIHHELRVAAKFLGVDVKQLHAELKGSSLADIATAHGVAPADLAAALTADVNARIDAAVAAGRLPADRAAKLKQRVSARVDALITRQGKV
jgi:hypothetical protein